MFSLKLNAKKDINFLKVLLPELLIQPRKYTFFHLEI